MSDSYGNYVPGLVSGLAAIVFTSGPSLSGTGAPSANPGFTFATYTDKSNGNQYFWNGTTWTQVSSGGGGTGGVFSGAATPEGNVTAPVGSIYDQIVGGVFTAQFIKAVGSGNTGWQ